MGGAAGASLVVGQAHRRGGPLPERYKRRNGPRVGATGVTLGLDTLWRRSRPANRGRTYQAALTSIFFASFCASGFLGNVTLSTPFLKAASILSVSMPSGILKLRS